MDNSARLRVRSRSAPAWSAARPFERNFSLADHVEVEGATFDNGLLHIDLVRRVPEAMKPRRIEIGAGPATVKGNEVRAIKAA